MLGSKGPEENGNVPSLGTGEILSVGHMRLGRFKDKLGKSRTDVGPSIDSPSMVLGCWGIAKGCDGKAWREEEGLYIVHSSPSGALGVSRF